MLKVAVIGMGNIGNTHAPAYTATPWPIWSPSVM